MGFIKESDAFRSRVTSCSVEMAIDLARFGNGHPPPKRDFSHCAKISVGRVSWVIVSL